MSDHPVTLRTRKFIRNPLLSRKQMVLYVNSKASFHISFHPSEGTNMLLMLMNFLGMSFTLVAPTAPKMNSERGLRNSTKQTKIKSASSGSGRTTAEARAQGLP